MEDKMNTGFKLTESYARDLDQEDPLRGFRGKFQIGDENTIYLDGNSLGRLPLKTKQLISEITEKQWGNQLIESWNQHWYEKPGQLGDKIAPVIGATPGEVIVSDSTSVNLYKLASAALRFQKGKKKIVSDRFNFPTDLYILEGILKEFGPGYHIELAGSSDNISIDTNDLKAKITDHTALVVLSLVAFKSSYLYDAAEITAYAHHMGAMVLWDLSHAAGAVPVNLNQIKADLAVGCTYKYFNGGPGSPAFLYVRKDLQDKLESPVQGWFGDHQPFRFDMTYQPAAGIRRFLAGTPPVISLMAIEPGIDLLREAGMEKIHQKSMLQTSYFLFLARLRLEPLGFSSGSPAEQKHRGAHVSLKHPEAYRICQALIHPQQSSLKIIPDFREPDNIRFGLTPLYTSFFEIWQSITRLKEIMQNEEYKKFPVSRKPVT